MGPKPAREAPLAVIDKVCDALHGRHRAGLTPTQRFVAAAIIAAVLLAIFATEPDLPDETRAALAVVEVGFGILFLVEYVARVWSIGARHEFKGLRGRLRYMATPLALVDAIALLPFLFGAIGSESMILRLIRVMRIIALAKMARYSVAMRVVLTSIVERRFELIFAASLAAFMILISSAALYVLEGGNQPEAFGSIARSMWWAVATLTTVGYGDVVPITPLGKVFAAITSIAGIAMIALPTGILAAAFSDGFSRARRLKAESHHGGA
jgi:voltage-gated potassium channel